MHLPCHDSGSQRHPLPSATSCPRRTGVTLVELLAAIGVIGILALIIIPVIGNFRARASQVNCLSNLRNIGAGLKLYEIDNPNEGIILDYRFNVQLWPYVYPERADENVSVSGDPPPIFKGTVFECPDVYEDAVRPRRSYGVNVELSRDFSFADGTVSAQRIRPVTLQEMEPGTVFIGDVGGGTSATSYLRTSTIHGRHKGKANVLHFDGSCASVEVSSELRARPATASFWTGIRPPE